MKHLPFRHAAPMTVAMCIVAACNTVCPGGHDPEANPGGEACMMDDECRVECICVDDENEEEGIMAGECIGGSCVDAVELCADSCGTLMSTGEYCKAPSSES